MLPLKKILSTFAVLTMSLTAAAQQIPTELHGAWGKSIKDCKNIFSTDYPDYEGFTADKKIVQFAMSTCTAKKSAKFDGKNFSSTYICASEGEEYPRSFSLSLLAPMHVTIKDEDGTRKYMKCSK